MIDYAAKNYRTPITIGTIALRISKELWMRAAAAHATFMNKPDMKRARIAYMRWEAANHDHLIARIDQDIRQCQNDRQAALIQRIALEEAIKALENSLSDAK